MAEQEYIWDNVAKLMWPVGSVYIYKRSSLQDNFNPASFTDATWKQIKTEQIEDSDQTIHTLIYFLRTA